MFDSFFDFFKGERFKDTEYTLFNKRVPVADLRVGQLMGEINDVVHLYNREALPIPALFTSNVKDGLNYWFRNRSISTSRIRNGEIFGTKLSLQNLGLNLSDQYWFRPKGCDFTWDDVNLFQNYFDIKYFDGISHIDPSCSSNGEQEKYWEIRGKDRVLVKVSRRPFYQEAANEVFSSRLLDKLGVPHISYWREGKNSLCVTGIDVDTEYVPVSYFLSVVEKNSSVDQFSRFWQCADVLRLPVEHSDIGNMLVFYFLINNVDRNLGNFGFVRKAETGEFLGLFPYFDHGNSMWFNENVSDIDACSIDSVGKPFGSDSFKQLNYVSSLSLRFDLFTKDFLVDTVKSVYSGVLDDKRVSKLSIAVCDRLDMILDRFQGLLNVNDNSVEVDHSWAEERIRKHTAVVENRLAGIKNSGNDSNGGVGGGRL